MPSGGFVSEIQYNLLGMISTIFPEYLSINPYYISNPFYELPLLF